MHVTGVLYGVQYVGAMRTCIRVMTCVNVRVGGRVGGRGGLVVSGNMWNLRLARSTLGSSRAPDTPGSQPLDHPHCVGVHERETAYCIITVPH